MPANFSGVELSIENLSFGDLEKIALYFVNNLTKWQGMITQVKNVLVGRFTTCNDGDTQYHFNLTESGYTLKLISSNNVLQNYYDRL
jgi:hypothetical protein